MKKFLTLIILAASVISCTENATESEPRPNNSLNLSVGALQAEKDGGEFKVTVTADCDWQAICTADWVTLSPQAGTAGESTLTVTVAGNTETETRSAKITVLNDNDVSQSITIKQDGKTDTDTDTEDIINIPDKTFHRYLVKHFDTDGDGRISKAEARAVKGIYCSFDDISSLEGIEYFTELDTLKCGNNQLSTLDISKCTQLKSLDCYSNQLTTLDVSNCTQLKNLTCGYNQLSTLDVSNCPELKILYCISNRLSTLDISNCSAMLISLNCSLNQLTTLDVSNCTHLVDFDCYSNRLSTLDVSNCPLTKSSILYSDNYYQTKTENGYLPLTLQVNKTQYEQIVSNSYFYNGFKDCNITIVEK